MLSINKVLLKPIYELTPPFGDALYNVLKTPVCVTIGSSAPVMVVHTPLAFLTISKKFAKIGLSAPKRDGFYHDFCVTPRFFILHRPSDKAPPEYNHAQRTWDF